MEYLRIELPAVKEVLHGQVRICCRHGRVCMGCWRGIVCIRCQHADIIQAISMDMFA